MLALMRTKELPNAETAQQAQYLAETLQHIPASKLHSVTRFASPDLLQHGYADHLRRLKLPEPILVFQRGKSSIWILADTEDNTVGIAAEKLFASFTKISDEYALCVGLAKCVDLPEEEDTCEIHPLGVEVFIYSKNNGQPDIATVPAEEVAAETPVLDTAMSEYMNMLYQALYLRHPEAFKAA